MNNKPRIKRQNGQWLCSYLGIVGYGDTPGKAYVELICALCDLNRAYIGK